MDLKELLGEELYNQVIEKAGDNKLAVVSDGNWFPKDKFDAKNQEVKDLQGQLTDRDEQLEELSEKAKGNEELTAQIDELKQVNETTKSEYEDMLHQKEFDHKLENSLSGANVKNTKAIKALLDMDLIKLKDGELEGLKPQMESLQESDDYLFKTEEPPNNDPQIVNGGNPQGGGAGKAPLGLKDAIAQRLGAQQNN